MLATMLRSRMARPSAKPWATHPAKACTGEMRKLVRTVWASRSQSPPKAIHPIIWAAQLKAPLTNFRRMTARVCGVTRGSER